MPAVDYAAAWDELQEELLKRDGWGTRTVVALMADLRVRHRIPESDAGRALRLAADAANDLAGLHAHGVAPAGGHPEAPKEGADEHRYREERAAAGL
jgi:hypothetical protein